MAQAMEKPEKRRKSREIEREGYWRARARGALFLFL